MLKRFSILVGRFFWWLPLFVWCGVGVGLAYLWLFIKARGRVKGYWQRQWNVDNKKEPIKKKKKEYETGKSSWELGNCIINPQK